MHNLIPDPLNWNQSRNKNSEELTFRPELFIDLLHNKFSYSVELIIQDNLIYIDPHTYEDKIAAQMYEIRVDLSKNRTAESVDSCQGNTLQLPSISHQL